MTEQSALSYCNPFGVEESDKIIHGAPLTTIWHVLNAVVIVTVIAAIENGRAINIHRVWNFELLTTELIRGIGKLGNERTA
jgi:hypothetical protein